MKQSARDYFSYSGCLDLAGTFPTLHKYILINFIREEPYLSYIKKYGEDDGIISIYEMLGLSEDSTMETLRKRYRELSKKFHPDTKGKDSETIFKEINNLCGMIGCGRLPEDEKKLAYDEWLQLARRQEMERRKKEICFEGPKGKDRSMLYRGAPMPYPNHLGHYINEAYPYTIDLSFGDEITINSEIFLSEGINPERVKEDYLFYDLLNNRHFSMKNLMHSLIYKHGYVGEIEEEQDEVSEKGKRGKTDGWKEELKVEPSTIQYKRALEQELYRTTIGRSFTTIGPSEMPFATRKLELMGDANLGEERWGLYRVAEIKGGEVLSGALLMMDLRGIEYSKNEIETLPLSLKRFLHQNLSPEGLKAFENKRITNGLYFLGRPMIDRDGQIKFSDLTERQKEIIDTQKRIEDEKER